MTEYEEVRSRAEAQAVACHAMSMEQILVARDMGASVLRSVGLSRERVWNLTRDMRRLGNGGVL